jgi:hypothetical protein
MEEIIKLEDLELWQLDAKKIKKQIFGIGIKQPKPYQINNRKFKTDFNKKVREYLKKQISELEKQIKENSLPELEHRKIRFDNLNKACKRLVNEILFNKEIWITDKPIELKNYYLPESWVNSHHFRAVANIEFLNYQLSKINELTSPDISDEQKPLNRLELPDKMTLLRLIGFFDKGTWFNRKYMIESKQKMKVIKILADLLERNEKSIRDELKEIIKKQKIDEKQEYPESFFKREAKIKEIYKIDASDRYPTVR